MSERDSPTSSLSRTRRFYENVAVTDVDGGYGILLNARELQTPGRARLLVASRSLAELVAAEWAGQGEKIEPQSMPVTRLVNSAIDQTASHRNDVIKASLDYAASDLLCYWAEAPEPLVERQRALWQPPLDWVAEHLGERFATARGLAHVQQHDAVLSAFGRALEGVNDVALTAYQTMAQMTGSAILALAVLEGYLDVDAAWAAASLDESWQSEQWGEDAEAVARQAHQRNEFQAVAQCAQLARLSA